MCPYDLQRSTTKDDGAFDAGYVTGSQLSCPGVLEWEFAIQCYAKWAVKWNRDSMLVFMQGFRQTLLPGSGEFLKYDDVRVDSE